MSGAVRFKTMLRGVELDVEMELVHGPNPAFTLAFHGRSIDPTRKELAYLCREAARVSKERQLQ